MALIMTVLHALSIAVGIVLLSRIFYRESSAPPPDRPKRFFGASARRAVQAALYGRPAMDCAHHLRGGGSDTESALAARVVSIADAIQRQLGEIVNKPGMKAIEAVLLMSMGAKSQKDVIAQVGTSKPSFLKYKPLVEQVLASCAVGATLAGAAALVGPSAAGVVGGHTSHGAGTKHHGVGTFACLRCRCRAEAFTQVNETVWWGASRIT